MNRRMKPKYRIGDIVCVTNVTPAGEEKDIGRVTKVEVLHEPLCHTIMYTVDCGFSVLLVSEEGVSDVDCK